MVDFTNTEIAFQAKSGTDIKRAAWLFRAMASPRLVKFGKWAIHWAIKCKLPIKGIIKATIFKQFCGGENITECEATTKALSAFHIGTILDYSVEGKTSDEDFETTTDIIISTIVKAGNQPHIPFAVFKMTGIGRLDLLETASQSPEVATEVQREEIHAIKKRFERICEAAGKHQVRLFIDAEQKPSFTIRFRCTDTIVLLFFTNNASKRNRKTLSTALNWYAEPTWKKSANVHKPWATPPPFNLTKPLPIEITTKRCVLWWNIRIALHCVQVLITKKAPCC
jgi:proline dehydrogenase